MSDSDNKTKYLPIAMCLGISIGSAFGLAIDNLAIGVCLGMSIGVGIGAALDAKHNKKDQ